MPPDNRILKVFVIHDSPLFRSKLLSLFDGFPQVAIAGEAGDALTAVRNLSITRPDILLLDLGGSAQSGFEILDYATRHLPHCRIVTLVRSEHALSADSSSDSSIDFRGKSSTGSSQAEKPADKNAAAHDQRLADKVLDPHSEAAIRRCLRSILDDAEPAERACAGPRGPDGLVRRVCAHLEYVSRIESADMRSPVWHTERRRGELERLASATRLQRCVEPLPGIPYIAALDESAALLYVSAKVQTLLGWSARELCDDPTLRSRCWHADDVTRIRAAIAEALATGTAYSVAYRASTRDGQERWLHDEARVITDAAGDPIFLQGVLLEVSEQQAAHAGLAQSHQELRRIIASLDALRQEEQKRLAQEMHDDLGQLLAAMKMDLSRLQQRLPESDSPLLQQLGGLNELVDAMVTSVRRIIADLPPKILDELSLPEALAFLASGFEKRYGIRCRLDLPLPDAGAPLSDALSAPVYRMAQEALNNAVKHAHPTRIDLRVRCEDGSLLMDVRDDGRGMASADLRKPGSFGLIGMRQRAAALGGDVRFESVPGGGTVVRIRIPQCAGERQNRQA